MTPLSIMNPSMRHATLALAAALLSGLTLVTAFASPLDRPASDAVGVIEGDSIAVTGTMSVEMIGGQAKTMLRSGSDVRVKSGSARIDLVEGGQISICGPAHFSVLKAAGALTIALENGTVHAHVEREPALTIYTAQIQAHTVAIGEGPQDVLVGFESPAAMCLRANRGAIRVEQQLTGQSVIIPQAGDVQLANGQFESLRNDAGHCVCELQTAKPPDPQPEVGQAPAMTEEESKITMIGHPGRGTIAAESTPAKEDPIYEVLMPPLVYDAKAKVQPKFDPEMIVLVRRVRVRPSLIFQGRVEGEAVVAAAAVAPQKPTGSAAAPAKPVSASNASFADRVRSFVRKLWSN